MPEMGLQFGLDKNETIYKRKFRWLFKIPDISAQGVSALPPSKAARPSLSFKEIEVQHVNETFFYPGKPEWKSFTLALYDIKCKQSPVMDWLKRLFDPQVADYQYIINGGSDSDNFKLEATLEMLDPCGNCLEKWTFENCWPQTADFQELDMGVSDVMMVDLTIRFDRAYMVTCGGGQSGGGPG